MTMWKPSYLFELVLTIVLIALVASVPTWFTVNQTLSGWFRRTWELSNTLFELNRHLEDFEKKTKEALDAQNGAIHAIQGAVENELSQFRKISSAISENSKAISEELKKLQDDMNMVESIRDRRIQRALEELSEKD